MGSRPCGGTPAAAVYSCSFPIGMPMPLAPRSPRPRMRPALVTQMKRTSLTGQFRSTSLTYPLRLIDRYIPIGRRMMWSNFRQASPIVGSFRTSVPCLSVFAMRILLFLTVLSSRHQRRPRPRPCAPSPGHHAPSPARAATGSSVVTRPRLARMLDAIPARGDTARAAKHRGEVAGRPEADPAGDLCDRQFRSSQELAGAGDALPDHEAMRRIAGAAPEQAREVEPAHVHHRGQLGQRQGLVEVPLDVLCHTPNAPRWEPGRHTVRRDCHVRPSCRGRADARDVFDRARCRPNANHWFY